MKRVVFVCSGNICRSPMAAGIARNRASAEGLSMAVISCGTLGLVGHPAAAHAVSAMAEIDIDISDHYSQGIAPQFIELSDYVVVMAPRHARAILRLSRAHESKLVRIWEFAEEDLNQIDDPVNQDLHAFRVCRDRLVECMDAWFATLQE